MAGGLILPVNKTSYDQGYSDGKSSVSLSPLTLSGSGQSGTVTLLNRAEPIDLSLHYLLVTGGAGNTTVSIETYYFLEDGIQRVLTPLTKFGNQITAKYYSIITNSNQFLVSQYIGDDTYTYVAASLSPLSGGVPGLYTDSGTNFTTAYGIVHNGSLIEFKKLKKITAMFVAGYQQGTGRVEMKGFYTSA